METYEGWREDFIMHPPPRLHPQPTVDIFILCMYMQIHTHTHVHTEALLLPVPLLISELQQKNS